MTPDLRDLSSVLEIGGPGDKKGSPHTHCNSNWKKLLSRTICRPVCGQDNKYFGSLAVDAVCIRRNTGAQRRRNEAHTHTHHHLGGVGVDIFYLRRRQHVELEQTRDPSWTRKTETKQKSEAHACMHACVHAAIHGSVSHNNKKGNLQTALPAGRLIDAPISLTGQQSTITVVTIALHHVQPGLYNKPEHSWEFNTVAYCLSATDYANLYCSTCIISAPSAQAVFSSLCSKQFMLTPNTILAVRGSWQYIHISRTFTKKKL